MSERTLSPTPPGLRDDRGFMLIEVLVSAIILVTASLAIFSTLTKADTAAGNQQIRVEAANFAQSELERIRSLPVEDIQDFAKKGTATVKRNGIPFTENVVAKWVSDGGDEPECTGQEGGLDYMRTTVTISWPNMGSLKAVSLTSLFTPNAGAGGTTGSISVHVINRDGGPVQDVAVNIVGKNAGGSFGGNTNQNGCVVFGFIPEDTYTLTGARLGYVDQDSNTKIQDSVDVTAGTTNKVEYSYDSGGWTEAKFNTTLNTAGLLLASLGVGSTTVKSYPPHFQIWHAQQTAPGGFDVDLPQNAWPAYSAPNSTNLFPTTTNQLYDWGSATTPAALLFPFSSPYTVYAGNCAANATLNSGGSTASMVNIPKMAFQNTGTVAVPALGIKVMSGTAAGALTQGNPVPNARVMVNFGCGTWTRTTAKANLTLAGWGSNGEGNWRDVGQSPWGIGTLADPGFPYATTVKYCAYDPATNKYSTMYATSNTNTNTGTTAPVIYMGAATSTTQPPTLADGTKAPVGSCQAP